MEIWLAPLLGVIGVIFGAAITGIINFLIYKNTIEENRQKQILELKNKFIKLANPSNKNFYENTELNYKVCRELLTEFDYLEAITSLNIDTLLNSKVIITNKISIIQKSARFKEEINIKLGKLKANIDVFNSLINKNISQQQIESVINNIYNLAIDLKAEIAELQLLYLDGLNKFSKSESEEVLKDLNSFYKSKKKSRKKKNN